MTETIQPEATTDSPPKRRGWDIVSFEMIKQPPEGLTAFIYLVGLMFVLGWFGVTGWLIWHLSAISLGFADTAANADSQFKAATVLLPTLAAVAAAPFLIWRLIMMQSQTTTALEKLEIDRQFAATAEAKLDIDRETQNTALYLKAVEMLGSMKEEKTTELVGGKLETKTISKPDLEKRIGALFALERLARDSERDQPAILDMLCAYVRRNSGLDDYDKQMVEDEVKGWPESRQDIQSAMTVIGQRKEKWRNAAAKAGKINLEQARLMHINLADLDFEKADFRLAVMQGANLQGAYLPSAYFFYTNLQGANLRGVNLEDAYLSSANLRKAYLEWARLQNTYLFGTYLYGADLTSAYDLIQDQLDSAFGDEATILPSYITRPAHWSTAFTPDHHIPF